MTHRARRVVHGRVIGVGKGHGVRGPGRGLLDVNAQEVVVGPPGPGPVPVRVSGRVTV